MYLTFRQTFAYILCTKGIQNIYKMFVYKMYPLFRQILYTKCTQNVCIQHFTKRFYTFCIQNLADVVLLILYTKCIQKFVEIWYTFCLHFAYILYTSVLYIFYNFCIQNVYTVSVCDGLFS